MPDSTVLSSEYVVRILNPEWVIEGNLQNLAFTLLENETYISVNRPAISTYDSDVYAFLRKHPSYIFSADTYKCALLNVGDIRGIRIVANGNPLDIDVEVEPRGKFTLSHAGIFTRFENKNIKRGTMLVHLTKGLSADDVLLKIRLILCRLAKIQTYEMAKAF